MLRQDWELICIFTMKKGRIKHFHTRLQALFIERGKKPEVDVQIGEKNNPIPTRAKL
jgi:hypothetical protein